MPFEKLKQLSDGGGVFDYIETLTLYRTHPKRSLAELRLNLDDGFRGYFDSRLAQMSARWGADSKVVKDTVGLSDFIRKRLVSTALDVLCLHGGKSELPTVRRVIDREDLFFSEVVLRFLSRYGSWADRQRVLSLEGKTSANSSGGFLGIPVTRTDLPIGRALYTLGKHRLADLLSLDTSAAVKRAIVASLAQADISKLSDDILLDQLSAKDDDLRRLLALRCSIALSKQHVQRLLLAYLKRETRYYNTIHWLDLAASMPRHVARRVAAIQLSAGP
jgi:hypothetical protein